MKVERSGQGCISGIWFTRYTVTSDRGARYLVRLRNVDGSPLSVARLVKSDGASERKIKSEKTVARVVAAAQSATV